VIGRGLAAAGAAALGVVSLRAARQRGADRLLAGTRRGPDEAALQPALDALGGEIIRFRARDGVRLAGRWLPAAPPDAAWRPDPREAILLLHGYSGSIAPDLVEYAPFLRATAGVLGIDFRGHGDADDGPTTFGLLEVEDVAGALAWLGERGIRRVALMGTSMGGMTALAAVAVLGDGSLPNADVDPDRPRATIGAPRPRIVAVVADSVASDPTIPVATRLPVPRPLQRFVAGRLFDGARDRLGADPRATGPARVIGLVEPVPLLLIHGAADDTVPVADGQHLADLAGPSAEHWVVPGAGHSGAHATAPQDYAQRVGDFLRVALARARTDDEERAEAYDMDHEPGATISDPGTHAMPAED
jgi:pimeloyl-ACP methyl ester carboxylesterase